MNEKCPWTDSLLAHTPSQDSGLRKGTRVLKDGWLYLGLQELEDRSDFLTSAHSLFPCVEASHSLPRELLFSHKTSASSPFSDQPIKIEVPGHVPFDTRYVSLPLSLCL